MKQVIFRDLCMIVKLPEWHIRFIIHHFILISKISPYVKQFCNKGIWKGHHLTSSAISVGILIKAL